MWRPRQYRRLTLLGVLLLAGFLALGLRVHHLMVGRHGELTAKARALTELHEPLPAWRGDIVARDGSVLATSQPAKTVYLDVQFCNDRLEDKLDAVTRVLGLDSREVRSRVQQGLLSSGRRHPDGPPSGAMVLRRKVALPEWQRITNALASEAFGLDEASLTKRQQLRLRQVRANLLFAVDDPRRIYPFGQLACHVLGYTTSAVQALSRRGAVGVEESMDSVLAGQPGFRWSARDAAGRELPHRRRVLRQPQDGGRVMLTLDVGLQAMVEDVLASLIDRAKPTNAAILIVRPATGEVLAWAGWPAFWPEAPGESPPEHWLNRPLWAPFEPGSTFKTFTLAAALEDRLTSLDELLDCRDYRVDRTRVIAHQRNRAVGLLPVRDAFAQSINPAHSRLAERLGRVGFLEWATRFGFAEPTGIALPGERFTRLDPLRDAKESVLAYAAFGQGIAVTQLQLTMAFCAVVNGGMLMRPMLIGRLHNASGRVIWHARPTPVRRVLRPEVSDQVREALHGAVFAPHATGRRAVPDGYECGGKTGTAQQAARDGRGYAGGGYISSFIGAVPIHDPELVVSVVIGDPQGAHGGGSVAAPVFSEVAGRAARLLGIPPRDTPVTLALARRLR